MKQANSIFSKNKNKLILLVLALVSIFAFAACGSDDEESGGNGFNTGRQITVVSREDGSGTRGAFVEITGVEVTDADGNSRDMTTVDAEIAPGTSVVIGSVAGNEYAIGYISLGSLNDTVTAIPINGVAATAANVQSGAYPLFRTFYIAVRQERDALTQEFIEFMLSDQGQEIVARNYTQVAASSPAYNQGSDLSGTIVVSGSTSVAPLMERFKEAFEDIHPGVTVEVHSAGTSAGIQAAINGIAHIGMSSRALRPAELESVEAIAIAYDGLAVIINNANPLGAAGSGLTAEEIRQIFVGDITRWNAILND